MIKTLKKFEKFHSTTPISSCHFKLSSHNQVTYATSIQKSLVTPPLPHSSNHEKALDPDSLDASRKRLSDRTRISASRVSSSWKGRVDLDSSVLEDVGICQK